MKWRYAVKLFDNTKKLTNEQVNLLKEIVNLAPTSSGLQPFKVLIIESDDIKTKLLAASYNQPQITTASHLFIFCANEMVDNNYADDYLNNIAETRGISRESIIGYEKMIKGVTSAPRSESKTNWAARQAYIALGTLTTSAALLGIDACPMEGFESEKYSEILNLKELNLKAFALVALGNRSENDKYSKLPKVRKPIDEIFLTF